MKTFGFRNYTSCTLSIIILLIINTVSNGQELDSLENLFKKESLKPALRIKLCDDLSWGYLSLDFNKSKFYALQGIETARAENDLIMEGTLYRNLGVAYYMASKLDSAN